MNRDSVNPTLPLLVALALISDGNSASAPLPADAAPRMKAALEKLQASREKLANDRFRPLFHLSSPAGKMHDPGGIAFWQGKYHLFYIAPGGKGHAVSDDLVHWQDLPINQLIGGLTGQMLVNGERALMSFGKPEGVYLAMASDPMLLDWERTLILSKEKDLPDHQQPIDTCFWRQGDSWWMLLRKHEWERGRYFFTGERPALSLFRSTDCLRWIRQGMFYEKKSAFDRGDDLACPNFLPFGQGRHLLLYFNHATGPMYAVGVYRTDTQVFQAEHHGRFSNGPVLRGTLHAPSAFIDPEGRSITVFNVTENRRHAGGWIGTMSLPRVISLREGYGAEPHAGQNMVEEANLRDYFNPLRIEPIPKLESLRHDLKEVGTMAIPAGRETVLPGVKGNAIELEAVLDPQDAREIGLNVLQSPGGAEKTTIRLYMDGAHGRSRFARTLSIDVSDASLDPGVGARTPESGPVWLEPGEPLRLRVFIDRSIIEVFANDCQCLTVRTYPSREDSTGVSVFAKGNAAELVSLKVWQMRSIWPELKRRE